MAITREQAEYIAVTIDWERVWRICIRDDNDRTFYKHPIERRLIELDLTGWLDQIRDRLHNMEYLPKGMTVCDAPKARGLIRPGGILVKEDQLVYTALLDINLQQLRNTLAWSQGVVDFSYQPTADVRATRWFSGTFDSWTSFRNASLLKLDEGYEYVVFTDISGYYDHISLSLLASDLRNIGCDPASIELLSECLNRWAQVPATGVPQGYSASDYLGKIYLNSIDQRLRQSGFAHTRYVDDIRVFCRTRADAKKAIVVLSGLLRERGLSLHSAKTEIVSREAALQKLQGVMPILHPVATRLAEEIGAVLGVDYLDVTTAIIDAVLRDKQDQIPGEILEEVFEDNIAHNDHFDSTLFHYLLKRMGNQRNQFALDRCSQLLTTHPHETKDILGYFRNLDHINDAADNLFVACLTSAESVYHYQRYQILEWVLANFQRCSNNLLNVARDICSDLNVPNYVRSYATEILGRFGNNADFETLRAAYDLVHDPLRQSEIIYAIRRMERGRRNEFYGRVRESSDYHDRAVLYAGAR